MNLQRDPIQLAAKLVAELNRRLASTDHRDADKYEELAGLRRATGPAAWFVLSELLSRVDPRDVQDGQVAISANVRSIATATGISKDTVARAVRRLIALGIVERIDERDRGSGRFGSSVYRIAIAEFHLEPHLPLKTG